MAESKKGGRKSPIDRSSNAAEFPMSRVPNVIKKEQLTTGEQRDKAGKSGKK